MTKRLRRSRVSSPDPIGERRLTVAIYSLTAAALQAGSPPSGLLAGGAGHPGGDRVHGNRRRGLAITHIFDQPQSGYSCSFDLRLDPMRLDHVGALKRLSTKGGDLEDSQQAID